MALKAKIKSLEEVDEALRSLYVERDGSFVLDVEDDGRQRALEHERQQRRAATEKLAALEAKLTELEAKPPAETAAGQAQDDARVKALEDQIAKLTKAVEGERELRTKAELQTAEDRHFGEVRKAVQSAGVRDELVGDFIEARIRKLYKLDPEKRAFTPLDPSNPASPLYGDEYAQSLATPEQLVKRVLADETAKLYLKPSSGPSISGSGANGQRGGFVLSASDARDPSKYRAAREAATKAGQEIIIQ